MKRYLVGGEGGAQVLHIYVCYVILALGQVRTGPCRLDIAVKGRVCGTVLCKVPGSYSVCESVDIIKISAYLSSTLE